ncbi:MAG: RNA-guided endonuclease InsQ/TnpB family protein [Xenococcaceae cyanobacterium]
MQVTTVACKLEALPEVALEIDATLEAFAAACTWINANTPPKLTNRTAMQQLVYAQVREQFGLSSNLAIQAVRRVCSNRKTARDRGKEVKGFAPTSAGYDARIFSFCEKNWTVSLKLLHSRQKFKLLIGNFQRGKLKGQVPTSATLVKRHKGDYYININLDNETPTPPSTDKVLGVDLGRSDIAHTSEGDNWSGKQITQIRDCYSKLRAVLQKKASTGTRSSRRRCRQLLRRLSGKEKRFQAWTNHNISRQLVSLAATNNQVIALEDLTGIRERTNTQWRGRTERRRSNSWAFYQLRSFLLYKACLKGVAIIFVNPAYTSRTCAKCFHIHPDPDKSYRSGKRFSCGHCGSKSDADLNGAEMIAAIGATINSPGGSYLACSLKRSDVRYLQQRFRSKYRATENPTLCDSRVG